MRAGILDTFTGGLLDEHGRSMSVVAVAQRARCRPNPRLAHRVKATLIELSDEGGKRLN